MNILKTAERLLAENTTIYLDPEGDADMGYLVGQRNLNLRIGKRVAQSMSAFPIVKGWLETIQHVVIEQDNTIGSWTDPDTGDLHLDVCTIYDDLYLARAEAARRGELAIWDIENSVEVRTHPRPPSAPYSARLGEDAWAHTGGVNP